MRARLDGESGVVDEKYDRKGGRKGMALVDDGDEVG